MFKSILLAFKSMVVTGVVGIASALSLGRIDLTPKTSATGNPRTDRESADRTQSDPAEAVAEKGSGRAS